MKATVELVTPIVVKIGETTVDLDDEGLNKNLAAMSGVLEKIWDDVDDYVKQGSFQKYTSSGSKKFSSDLHMLREALDILSETITGQTFVAVLRAEGKVGDIALGMYDTQQAVQGVAAQVTTIGKKKTFAERRAKAYVFSS